MTDLAVTAPGPTTRVDPSIEARLTNTGRVIRWIATGHAFVGLLGLVFPALRGFPPSPFLVRELTTSAAMSLAVLTLGALVAGDIIHSVRAGLALRRVGVVLSCFAALFGAAVIGVHFANRTDIWGEFLQVPAFSVGVVLLVLGISVPLSISRIESRVIAGQVGTLLVFSLTAVIFIGYVYGDPSVGRLFLEPEISFQASITSVLLATGILLIRPASGLLSVASSPGAGGRFLRRFGPVVLFTPALLLFVIETVPSSDRIDVLAFTSVGLGLFLLMLLALFVRTLDETAIEAATNAAQAERARTGLQQEAPVVTQISEMLHVVDVSDVDGWEVATRFRPGTGSISGDASAVRSLPDGKVGAVLVDMTGHGALPAVWAIRVRDLLLHSLFAGASTVEAMRLVEWSAPGDTLASALLIILDPKSGEVHMCSAGHPPVILVGAHEVSLHRPTGPLLYLGSQSEYEETSFEMSIGDSVVAFSDGVADVQVVKNERTEPELLADMLLAEGGETARTADLVLGFAESEPSDDQTVMVIRRTA